MPRKKVEEKKILKAATTTEVKRSTYRGVQLIFSTSEKRPGVVTISSDKSPLFSVTGNGEKEALTRAKVCVDTYHSLKEADAKRKASK